MTYVLSGVTVEVDHQAVRPREPARPSRALTVASPEMASRAPRPREGKTSFAPVDEFLRRIVRAKGKQKELEKLLKSMGRQLAAKRSAVQLIGQQGGSRAALDALKARILVLEKDIARCIAAIKQIASAANQAANSAIAAGANRATTQAAAAAGTAAASSTPIPASVEAAIVTDTVAQTAAEFAKESSSAPPASREERGTFTQQPSTVVGPTSGNDVVIESSTASVGPDGTITAGPDATVTTTPVLTEPGSPVVAVPASSGGIGLGTIAALGVAGFVAWRLFGGGKK